jgi:hypothetical protein
VVAEVDEGGGFARAGGGREDGEAEAETPRRAGGDDLHQGATWKPALEEPVEGRHGGGEVLPAWSPPAKLGPRNERARERFRQGGAEEIER